MFHTRKKEYSFDRSYIKKLDYGMKQGKLEHFTLKDDLLKLTPEAIYTVMLDHSRKWTKPHEYIVTIHSIVEQIHSPWWMQIVMPSVIVGPYYH